MDCFGLKVSASLYDIAIDGTRWKYSRSANLNIGQTFNLVTKYFGCQVARRSSQADLSAASSSVEDELRADSKG